MRPLFVTAVLIGLLLPPDQAFATDGASQPLIAQARQRRGRRKAKPQPEPKKPPQTIDQAEAKRRAAEKRRNARAKQAIKKKAAPKVAKPQAPAKPIAIGPIVLAAGIGSLAIGGGIAAWGAAIHNDAVEQRHELQAREASNPEHMQAFYDLYGDMETGKTMHYVGLGLSGFGALGAALGAFL